MVDALNGLDTETLLSYYFYLFVDPKADSAGQIIGELYAILEQTVSQEEDGEWVYRPRKRNEAKKLAAIKSGDIDMNLFQNWTSAFLSYLSVNNLDEINVDNVYNYHRISFVNIYANGFTDVFSNYIAAGTVPEALVWINSSDRVLEFRDWLQRDN